MGGPPPEESNSSDSKSQMRQLKEAVKEWKPTELIRAIQDRRGIQCIEIGTSRKSLYAISKDSVYKNRASFPKQVVQRGIENDKPLAIFFGDPPLIGNTYTFDAERVAKEGEENKSSHTPGNTTRWIDIDLSKGVIFGDYISGRVDIPKRSQKELQYEYENQ